MFKSLFKIVLKNTQSTFTGLSFLIFSSLLGCGASAYSQDLLPTGCTLEVDITGAIGPASLDLIKRVHARAEKQKCSSILLLINTPGGNLQTTRLIVEKILNSDLPYMCLISPSGAHAGSAGAIIMQACHVAGGLGTTNLGAATPVSVGGEKMQDDMRNKIMNDTRSWVEGLAERRGRNIQFAKDIVEKGTAVSSKEAQKIKAIDWVGDKKEEFLDFARTQKVQIQDKKDQSVLVGTVNRFEHDLRFKVMDLLTNPQVAYLIFMGSLGLLYFELTHPGAIVPGVIGGIGLIISLISLHMLDVAWGGLFLILLGLALMIAEAFVASFGVLGFGGVVSFFLGSLFLFDMDVQGYELSLSLILPTTILLGLMTFAIAYLAFSTRKVQSKGEYNDLVGHEGVVITVEPSGLKGQIEIEGEIWSFLSTEPLKRGDNVTVNGHKGFTLNVSKSIL